MMNDALMWDVNMGGFIFYYGTVSSAKTMNLLAKASAYKSSCKRVMLLTPEMDHRYGDNVIRSKCGLEAIADCIVTSDISQLPSSDVVDTILVDEAQFLPECVIDALRDISCEGPDVILYGLKTDFSGIMFPSSKRIMEIADDIKEIENVCSYCGEKATMNLRMDTRRDQKILLGGLEMYKAVCFRHHYY